VRFCGVLRAVDYLFDDWYVWGLRFLGIRQQKFEEWNKSSIEIEKSVMEGQSNSTTCRCWMRRQRCRITSLASSSSNDSSHRGIWVCDIIYSLCLQKDLRRGVYKRTFIALTHDGNVPRQVSRVLERRFIPQKQSVVRSQVVFEIKMGRCRYRSPNHHLQRRPSFFCWTQSKHWVDQHRPCPDVVLSQ